MDRISMIAERIAGVAFDITTADEWGRKIYEGLSRVAPFVNVSKSTLGGADKVSILFVVSLDEKRHWNNGILENSTYFRMHLDNDGSLENFSGHTRPFKFRKTRVKSAEEVVAKVSRFIEDMRRGMGRKWQVMTDTLHGWENVWTDEKGMPTTFDTEAEAKAELDDHLKSMEDAVARGDMQDVQPRSDFKIVPVRTASSDWMTAAEVGEICQACEEKMVVAGISRVRRSYFEEAMRKAGGLRAPRFAPSYQRMPADNRRREPCEMCEEVPYTERWLDPDKGWKNTCKRCFTKATGIH